MSALEQLAAVGQFVWDVASLACAAVVALALLVGAWRLGKWLVHRYAVVTWGTWL